MTVTVALSDLMLHQLVAGSHAEGTTRLAVAAAIEHNDHTLCSLRRLTTTSAAPGSYRPISCCPGRPSLTRCTAPSPSSPVWRSPT